MAVTTDHGSLDSPQAWRAYLDQQSQRAIEAMPDWQREDNEVVLGRWAGQDPATQEDVAAAEERLQITFPRRYRTFLLASNGWSSLALYHLYGLYPVSEVKWMREEMPGFAEELADDDMEEWASMVRRGLVIGSGGDGVWWLLDQPAEGSGTKAYVWAMGSGEDPEPYPHFAAAVVHAIEA